jgi:hypothetical protein
MLRDVAESIRAVAQLRALCHRLPHSPTPAERERLQRFEALAAAPESATEEDIQTLATGWRQWWRNHQYHRILSMAEGLPNDLANRDRELSSLLSAAKRSSLRSPSAES